MASLSGAGLNFPARRPAKEVCCVNARRILPGHQAVSSRRTHRIRGIAIRESHSTGRQSIHVRRIVEATRVVGPDIHVAEVIDQKNNEIQRAGRLIR